MFENVDGVSFERKRFEQDFNNLSFRRQTFGARMFKVLKVFCF
jgi:hypothetical protein